MANEISLIVRLKNFIQQGMGSVKRSAAQIGKETNNAMLRSLGRGAFLGAVVVGIKRAVEAAKELKEKGDFGNISEEGVNNIIQMGERIDELKKKLVSVGLSITANVTKKVKEAAGFWGALFSGSSVRDASQISIEEGMAPKEQKDFGLGGKPVADLQAEIAENSAKVWEDVNKQIADNHKDNLKQQFEEDKKALNEWVDARIKAQEEAAEAEQKRHDEAVKNLEKERKLVETNRSVSIKKLDDEISLLEELADAHQENYETARRLVVDPEFRKDKEDEEKQKAKEERLFNKVLSRARRKIRLGRGSLTKQERTALTASRELGQGRQVADEAESKKKQLDDLQRKADEAIIHIEQKIDQLLVLK